MRFAEEKKKTTNKAERHRTKTQDKKPTQTTQGEMETLLISEGSGGLAVF